MTGDFFEGVERVEMKYNGGTGYMPIFYREARSFTFMMPANWFALRRMVPDPRFLPVQAFPGVGVVSLTAFEYQDTDIGPYNEFSVGIVLNNPLYSPLPCYNMLRQYLAKFYYVYVYHLPVTTEIALRAGVDFYNYPKIIADIDFEDTAGGVRCTLTHEGQRILSMEGDKIPAGPFGEMKFMCQLYMNRQPQQAEFKLNVKQGKVAWGPDHGTVELDMGHPMGREVYDALLSSRPLAYLYMPEMQGILYGPDHYDVSLVRRQILTAGMVPSRKPARKKTSSKKSSGEK